MSDEALKNNTNTAPIKLRHEGYAANLEILLAMLPVAVMALFMYGVRILVMLAVAFVTAIICDRLVAVMRRQKYDGTELSSLVIAALITFLMPAAIDYYVIVVAVSAAVLVGKHLFGGYGAYPFNPAALGYAVAVVCWPDEIFKYTTPFNHVSVLNASKTAVYTSSAASSLHLGGLPSISFKNMIIGNIAGGVGTTAALVLISCFVFLLIRKRVSIITPAAFVAACAFIAFVFPRVQASRIEVMKYELLSGTLIYGAVFLLSDMTTMPKNKISRLVYGIVLGVVTMMFRYYGTYESGICFAILFVNSISGYLDRIVSKLSGKYIVYKQNKKLNADAKPEKANTESEENKTAEKGETDKKETEPTAEKTADKSAEETDKKKDEKENGQEKTQPENIKEEAQPEKKGDNAVEKNKPAKKSAQGKSRGGASKKSAQTAAEKRTDTPKNKGGATKQGSAEKKTGAAKQKKSNSKPNGEKNAAGNKK